MTSKLKTYDISVLASTAIGQQAIKEIEAQRSAQRSAIIDRLAGEIKDLEKQQTEAKAEAKLRERATQEAHAAFAAAAERLHSALARASTASFAQDNRRARARQALGSLGQTIIESTRHALRIEYPRLLNLIQVRVSRDERGNKISEVDTNPEATQRLQLVKEYLAELDQMEFADVAPTAIEARCAQMMEDASIPDPAARSRTFAFVSGLPR